MKLDRDKLEEATLGEAIGLLPRPGGERARLALREAYRNVVSIETAMTVGERLCDRFPDRGELIEAEICKLFKIPELNN